MRDLVGYGWKYPKIQWPQDARVVVSLVLNYEEGAELCIGDGDPEGERVGEFVYPTMDSKTRDLGIESTFEYGSRVGTWRVLDLLDEFDAPVPAHREQGHHRVEIVAGSLRCCSRGAQACQHQCSERTADHAFEAPSWVRQKSWKLNQL